MANDDSEEMPPARRPSDSVIIREREEWHMWRGQVQETLKHVGDSLKRIEKKVDALTSTLAGHIASDEEQFSQLKHQLQSMENRSLQEVWRNDEDSHDEALKAVTHWRWLMGSGNTALTLLASILAAVAAIVAVWK